MNNVVILSNECMQEIHFGMRQKSLIHLSWQKLVTTQLYRPLFPSEL